MHIIEESYIDIYKNQKIIHIDGLYRKEKRAERSKDD
jgi:hypothetical protein